jgi:AcrR family transcriptional regulator
MSEAPARRSRAESQRETRDRLLDAAAVELAEHGFHGASIDAITARAGFTRGAFYSNFDDKADLLVELAERRVDAFEADQLPGLLTVDRAERARALAGWLATEDDPAETLLLLELARLAPTMPEAAEALEGVLTAIARAVAAALARADEVDGTGRRVAGAGPAGEPEAGDAAATNAAAEDAEVDDHVAAVAMATLGIRVMRAMRGRLDLGPAAILLEAVVEAAREPRR